jgi:3-hydroxybutyryl-CoA dehydrogenase
MGPVSLVDLVGADVASPVMEAIYEQYFHEPAYQPSQVLNLRKQGGILGRKTGKGFYEYSEGKKLEAEAAGTPDARPPRVYIGPGEERGAEALKSLAEAAGVEVETGSSPSTGTLTLLPLLGTGLSTEIARVGLDPSRTVAVDTLFGLEGVRTLMICPATSKDARLQAHGLLGADHTPVAVINDSPGFVAQRLVAMIVNVACHMAQRGVATPEDIDKASKLGLNYPKGPFELATEIGPDLILEILESLEAFYGEPRYRPAAWLRRRVDLGVPLTSPDARP